MSRQEHDVLTILTGSAPADTAITVKGWVRTRRDSKAGISFVQLSDGSAFHPLQVEDLRVVAVLEGDKVKPLFPRIN